MKISFQVSEKILRAIALRTNSIEEFRNFMHFLLRKPLALRLLLFVSAERAQSATSDGIFPAAICQRSLTAEVFAVTKQFTLRLGIWCFAVSNLLAGGPVHAGAPADEVKATVDNVLGVLRDANFKGPDKQKDRRAKLKSIIFPKFDFAEMAKRSLGAHWARRTAEEQKTFVSLFTELIESSYVDAIESYEGEKIVMGNERQDKGFAEVSTKIISKKGDPFAIDYRLQQTDSSWKVYDVVVENISLVNNYRAQFNRVIAKNSYEELLNRIKDKQFDAPKKETKT